MKRNRDHIRIPVLSFFLWLMTFSTWAQQSNTFYLMHDVPQSNLLNPAVQIGCKWFIGIPGLTSTHVSYSNTAFTYKDVASTDTWNVDRLVNQMHRVDLVATEALVHLISVGYKHQSLYFTFNITDKSHMVQTVPKDLAVTTLYGNASFAGETARFNSFRSTGYYNRQYSLGLSKVIDSYLTLGLRANLIFGKANLYTSKSNINFSTDERNFDLLIEGDYVLNSSFPMTITTDDEGMIEDISLDEIDPKEFLLNRQNPGYSIDLGAIYKYNEQITFSASLLDLGIVHWRSELNNVTGSGTFSYMGTDPDGTIISRDFLNEMIDSIVEAFNPTFTQDPYYSFLPAQLFLAGSYKASDKITLGAVNRNLFFRGKVHSSITVSAQTNLAHRFMVIGSWSYLNNTLKNIGLGLAYYGKGFQVHAVSDNLLGFFYPFDTRTVNLRIGFNMLLGCPGKKKKNLQRETYGPMPPVNNCSPKQRSKKREKQMQRAAKNQNRNN